MVRSVALNEHRNYIRIQNAIPKRGSLRIRIEIGFCSFFLFFSSSDSFDTYMNEQHWCENWNSLANQIVNFTLDTFLIPVAFSFRSQCGRTASGLIDRRLFHLIYLIANAIAKWVKWLTWPFVQCSNELTIAMNSPFSQWLVFCPIIIITNAENKYVLCQRAKTRNNQECWMLNTEFRFIGILLL